MLRVAVYQEQPTASLHVCTENTSLPAILCTSSSTTVNSLVPLTAGEPVVPRRRSGPCGSPGLLPREAGTAAVPPCPWLGALRCFSRRGSSRPGSAGLGQSRRCSLSGSVPWLGARFRPAHPQLVVLAGPFQLGIFYDEPGLLACPRGAGGAREAPF